MENTKDVPFELPRFYPLTTTSEHPEEEQNEFFTKLSEQVGVWSRYNFGIQDSWRPAMGMLEELNELQEGLNEFDRDKMLDAVADVTIYMADYYSIRGWDMGGSWNATVTRVLDASELHVEISRLCRLLARFHLKGAQGIRGGANKNDVSMQETCAATLYFLERICQFLNVDYIATIATVWRTVSKRDWRKNRDDAHKVAETEAKTS